MMMTPIELDIHDRPTLPDPDADRPTLPRVRIDTAAEAFFAMGDAIERAGSRWTLLARVVAATCLACAGVILAAALGR